MGVYTKDALGRVVSSETELRVVVVKLYSFHICGGVSALCHVT